MYSNELQHFGVKGMKWGKTKAAGGPTGKEVRKAAAVDRISRSGGSKGKAALKEYGKMMAKSVALGLGAQLVGQISGSPAVAKGARAAANIIATDAQVRGVNRIYNIAKA